MLKNTKILARRFLGLGPLVGSALALLWVLSGASLGGAVTVAIQLRDHPVLVFLALETIYVAVQTFYWFRYRPFADGPDEGLPTLSVIIPAFNEGAMVERSICSVAEADYPHDRLEILVVDDGSRDDTFFHMQNRRRTYPHLVRLIRFAGNEGKRAALRAGVLAARGEIVLTLDSDSQLDSKALRQMVAPFRDPAVGGVAGRVMVLNRDETWIGRMLDVQYTFSFDFLRAAQSSYRTVMVCPGALSAFRRSIILPKLDEWTRQSFWGRPVGHGEDQALTNIVLRAGFDTVYQRAALVRTLVPERYHQLCRMLVRWDRSFIVEGLTFAKFMFTRYRKRNRVVPIVTFCLGNLRLLLFFIGLLNLPLLLEMQPFRLVHYSLLVVIVSSFTGLYYIRTEWSHRFLYAVAYTFYSFFALQWILPWALITVRDERWGTR